MNNMQKAHDVLIKIQELQNELNCVNDLRFSRC